MKRSIALFLFLIISLRLAAHGQAVSARLEGLVQDSAKAVIVSAKVSVVQQETGFAATTTTNNDGLYVFPNLPPGHYTISVEAPGLATSTIKGVDLEIGDSRREDAILSVAGASTTVSVAISHSSGVIAFH